MKINNKIEEAVNKQINSELYSAYLYLSMSAYFESVNLKGFAHWMRKQMEEEMEHAMKFYRYLADRGGRVKLGIIEQPKSEWKSAAESFEDTYRHEQKVTEMIDSLINLSISEKDNATKAFLQWFVNEQVEEEAQADEILQKLKLIGDSANGLLMLDKELGSRK